MKKLLLGVVAAFAVMLGFAAPAVAAPGGASACSAGSPTAQSCIYGAPTAKRLPPDVFAGADCTGLVFVGVSNPNAVPVEYTVTVSGQRQQAKVPAGQTTWFDFPGFSRGETVPVTVKWGKKGKMTLTVSVPTGAQCQLGQTQTNRQAALV